MDDVATGGMRSATRRTLFKALGTAGAVAGLSTYAAAASAATPVATTAAASAAPAYGKITAAGVDRALRALPGIIERGLAKTCIPGVAIAVVYDGKVRYSAGLGVRAVGKPEKVNADTVFYLASVSKPISSTVVAAALTRKVAKVSWNTTVASQLPGFTLSDPWVGSHVTVADMFSHRSGLPDHAGNLLEDMGFDRDQIIAKLAAYPLGPFRDDYEYTNYGLTAGAEAVAAAAQRPWSTLAEDMIFKPLGMTSTSYTYQALRSRSNRVALHQKVKGRYVARPDADYEGQAPAGSASSSARDMATWAGMLLAGGKFNGGTVIAPEELNSIWSPAFMNHAPAAVGAWGSFYGYGWNVKYENAGELQVSHSGAFGRGAATALTLYPTDQLAIVGLANAAPVGLPEAISAEFVDFIRYGKSTRNWLEFIGPFFREPVTADQVKYSKPATAPKPARGLASYVGTYPNSTYGPLTVKLVGHALSLTVGPRGEAHVLRHYSGDEFFFETTGEDASGFSGAVFHGPGARITSVTVPAWNHDGLGKFTRA